MVCLQIWGSQGGNLSQALALISEHGHWRIQGSDGHMDSLVVLAKFVLGFGVLKWAGFVLSFSILMWTQLLKDSGFGGSHGYPEDLGLSLGLVCSGFWGPELNTDCLTL